MVENVANGNGAKRLLEQAGVTTCPLLIVLLIMYGFMKEETNRHREREEEIERGIRRNEERLRSIEADADRLERRTRFLPQSQR